MGREQPRRQADGGLARSVLVTLQRARLERLVEVGGGDGIPALGGRLEQIRRLRFRAEIGLDDRRLGVERPYGAHRPRVRLVYAPLRLVAGDEEHRSRAEDGEQFTERALERGAWPVGGAQ